MSAPGFSSVTAFLARAVGPAAEPDWQRVLGAIDLDDEARTVAALQALPARERLAAVSERTGERWTPAQLAHAEARTFVAIRRALQQRGLWRD